MSNIKGSEVATKEKTIAVFWAALSIIFYIADIVWCISLHAFPKSNIMLQIIYLIPLIIWFVYVLTLYKKEKSKIIVQIIFGILALSAMINCITGLFNIKTIMETSASILDMLTLIIYPILQVTLLALTIYMVSNKINSAYKPLIGLIIAFIARVIIHTATIYRFMSTDLIKFSAFSGIAYTLTFYLSAVIFFKYYYKLSPSLKTADVTEYFNPQQSLTALQSQFDSGAITEEEYNQKRAEILNSL